MKYLSVKLLCLIQCLRCKLQWDAFCVPELNNFLRVLDREEDEYLAQLKYKYKVMKRLILQRMKELRLETERQKRASTANESVS